MKENFPRANQFEQHSKAAMASFNNFEFESQSSIDETYKDCYDFVPYEEWKEMNEDLKEKIEISTSSESKRMKHSEEQLIDCASHDEATDSGKDVDEDVVFISSSVSDPDSNSKRNKSKNEKEDLSLFPTRYMNIIDRVGKRPIKPSYYPFTIKFTVKNANFVMQKNELIKKFIMTFARRGSDGTYWRLVIGINKDAILTYLFYSYEPKDVDKVKGIEIMPPSEIVMNKNEDGDGGSNKESKDHDDDELDNNDLLEDVRNQKNLPGHQYVLNKEKRQRILELANDPSLIDKNDIEQFNGYIPVPFQKEDIEDMKPIPVYCNEAKVYRKIQLNRMRMKFRVTVTDGKKSVQKVYSASIPKGNDNGGMVCNSNFFPSLQEKESINLKFIAEVEYDEDFMEITHQSTKLVGISNQGCTCYLNSLLQTLFHTHNLRKAVYAIDTNRDKSGDGVALEMQRLFFELETLKNGSAVDTASLTKAFGWNDNQVFIQQDVQELLRTLLDKLEERMKAGNKKQSSNNNDNQIQNISSSSSKEDNEGSETPISEIFSGKVRSYITCKHVDCKSYRDEKYYDIQLDVKGLRNVEESFSKFIEEEDLIGENQYASDTHGKQDAVKGTKFLSFPPVLHLHLKRFGYDPYTDHIAKINDRYEFPRKMKLAKYLHESVEIPDDGYQYELHSVLVHSGGVLGGHYFAYIRVNGEWYKFDDEVVSSVSAAVAINGTFGGSRNSNLNYSNTTSSSSSKKKKQWRKFIPVTREQEEKMKNENDTDDDNSNDESGYDSESLSSFGSSSNAYMLVYMRSSMKDQIMSGYSSLVPERLRERFEMEKEEKEKIDAAKKEKSQIMTLSLIRMKDNVENFTDWSPVRFKTVNLPEKIEWCSLSSNKIKIEVKKSQKVDEVRSIVQKHLDLKNKPRLWSIIRRETDSRIIRVQHLLNDDETINSEVIVKKILTNEDNTVYLFVDETNSISDNDDDQEDEDSMKDKYLLIVRHYDTSKEHVFDRFGKASVLMVDRLRSLIDYLPEFQRLAGIPIENKTGFLRVKEVESIDYEIISIDVQAPISNTKLGNGAIVYFELAPIHNKEYLHTPLSDCLKWLSRLVSFVIENAEDPITPRMLISCIDNQCLMDQIKINVASALNVDAIYLTLLRENDNREYQETKNGIFRAWLNQFSHTFNGNEFSRKIIKLSSDPSKKDELKDMLTTESAWNNLATIKYKIKTNGPKSSTSIPILSMKTFSIPKVNYEDINSVDDIDLIKHLSPELFHFHIKKPLEKVTIDNIFEGLGIDNRNIKNNTVAFYVDKTNFEYQKNISSYVNELKGFHVFYSHDEQSNIFLQLSTSENSFEDHGNMLIILHTSGDVKKRNVKFIKGFSPILLFIDDDKIPYASIKKLEKYLFGENKQDPDDELLYLVTPEDTASFSIQHTVFQEIKNENELITWPDRKEPIYIAIHEQEILHEEKEVKKQNGKNGISIRAT